MKIPESIRIGGVDYEIVDTPGLNDGARIYCGRIDFDKSIIELNPEVHGHQTKCITLWHEIIHGIINHVDMDVKESDEEKIVDTIARGVYQVLQDNGRKLFDIAVVTPDEK